MAGSMYKTKDGGTRGTLYGYITDKDVKATVNESSKSVEANKKLDPAGNDYKDAKDAPYA